MAYRRKEQKMSKVAVIVSIILHGAVVCIVIALAAREGMFGKRFKRMVVTMVPEPPAPEVPKETPKPKPIEEPTVIKQVSPPPKVEPIQIAKATPVHSPNPEPTVQPIPPTAVPLSKPVPLTAPPPASIPGLFFDGGQQVESSSDPNTLYNSFVEYSLRSNWKRPDNLADVGFIAEVAVGIDRNAKLTGYEFVKGSGNAEWDNSVRQALAQTKSLSRTPPKGFPAKVLVRFDVQVEANALKP